MTNEQKNPLLLETCVSLSFKNREWNDLQRLFGCVLATMLTWILYLKWTPGCLAPYNDAWTLWLPYVRNLIETGGNDLISYSWFGGTVLRLTDSTPVVFRLGRWLGLGPVGIVNLTAFSAQLCIAYFCCNIVGAWLVISQKPLRMHPILFGAIITLFCGFAPVIGWRVEAGQIHNLLALAAFIAGLMLLLQSIAKSMSTTASLLALWAFLQGLTTSGHQMLIYCVIFGFPIIIGFLAKAWNPKTSRPGNLLELCKRCLLPAALLVSALLIAAPSLYWVLIHARSSDAYRNLEGGRDVVFSYSTQVMSDWIGALLWRKDFFVQRDSLFLHETDYAFGPILLLVLAFLFKRERLMAVLLLVSGLLAMSFSMGAEPITSILLKWVTVLNVFRVPARTVLPFALCLPVFTCIWFFSTDRITEVRVLVPAGILFLLMLFVPIQLRDSLSILAVVVCLVFLLMDKIKRYRPLGVSLSFAILLGCSVSAFRERLSTPKEIAPVSTLGRALVSRISTGQSPMSRVYSELDLPLIGRNSLEYMGVGSTKGYGHPPKRFVELYEAWFSEPDANSMRMVFWFNPAAARNIRWFELYNIEQVISTDTNQQVVVKKGSTLGPAWFSQKIVMANDIDGLVKKLDAPEVRLQDIQLLNSQDSVLQERINAMDVVMPDKETYSGRISANAREGQPIRLDFSQPIAHPRPLTVSLNFFEFLKATAIMQDGKKVDVPIYPAYHALTGIIVPAGAKTLIIEPDLAQPVTISLMPWLGITLALFCLYILVWKSNLELGAMKISKDIDAEIVE